MKLTIVYDNTSVRDDIKADWGFAVYIEHNDRKILFDTGCNGKILIENMKRLEINIKSLSDIVISHYHLDHTGGLSHILNISENAVIHVPPSVRGLKYKNKVIFYNDRSEIAPGVYVSGEINGIEQAMAVRTDKGLVVIIGCRHCGLGNILESFSALGTIHLIIGGLHDFTEYGLLEETDLVCPTHCTQGIDNIKDKFQGKYIKGGAGLSIEYP